MDSAGFLAGRADKVCVPALAELVANDTATCRYCGNVIDINTESWRTRLAEQAEIHKKIKPV